MSTETDMTRRSVLALAAAGSIGAVAGCLGDDTSTPDPVALDQGQACDNCGMEVDVHPGPVGQAYYTDERPSTLPEGREDGRATFCSTWCLYKFVLEAEQRGTDATIRYATDYSTVQYDLYEDQGTTVITAHVAAGDFTPTEDLTYVVDSEVEGAMGASLIGFSEESDAERFADDHGGVLTGHGDITLETITNM
jgi:copper chaperone NosL